MLIICYWGNLLIQFENKLNKINNIKYMEQKNSLIPASIIVAGLLIAGGLYFSNKPSAPIVQNQQGKVSQISIKPIDANEHLLGNPNAPVTIVEFSDTECPFCKNFQQTINKVET